MKQLTLIIAVILIGIGTFYGSCYLGSKNDLESLGITKNGDLPDGFKSNGKGLIYKYLSHGTGDVSPQKGDYVTISMSYTDGDTLLFDSKNLGYPMQLPIIKPTFKGDVYDGLAMMKVGDSMSFKCNADSVFLKLFRMSSVPHEVNSIEYIYFTIKLNKIQTSEEFQSEKEAKMASAAEIETVAREAYLQSNYPDAKPTESGLHVIVEKKGTGENAEAGKKVKVHYTGTFLDGSKFDSSVDRGEPIEFTLGQGQVIPGWDEGIGMMKVGEKSVLVIPSNLAYGPGGRGSIPPSSTLVFEVELIEIQHDIGMKSTEIQKDNENNDCSKFLVGYEKFMNEYIAAIKKFKKNPNDASIISDYSKMLQEASKWAAFDEECANDPKFIGKYTEIQMKIAQAASGIQLKKLKPP